MKGPLGPFFSNSKAPNVPYRDNINVLYRELTGASWMKQ
jgi:hypothetical protein